MKNKLFVFMLLGSIVLAACATPAPVAETAPAEASPVVEMAAAEQLPPEGDATPAPAKEMPAVAESAVAVSFSQDVWPILEKFAVAAHGGKGGVFLESYADVSKYVVAGDPKNSMLYKALIGDGLKRMPPDAPLPDEMIQTIYDWIQQGALDN